MPRYRVIPYRQGSNGARALAEAVGGRVLKLRGSTFRPENDDVIINWGSTDPENTFAPFYTRCLNQPDIIRGASNKRTFFQTFAEAGLREILPRFWANRAEIPEDAFRNGVVCRTVLAGHSGDGIHIANTRADLVPAPLYTEYVKKRDEYRIHIGKRGGNPAALAEQSIIIAIQRKAKRNGFAGADFKVRNHANGFVYMRTAVNPPACVAEAARRAFWASGLDFGAVDVIYNERQNRAYVLEINTAPGIEGTTINDYANFFRPRRWPL